MRDERGHTRVLAIITLESKRYLVQLLETPSRKSRTMRLWSVEFLLLFVYLWVEDWRGCRRTISITSFRTGSTVSLRDHTPSAERSQPKDEENKNRRGGPSVAVSHSLVCCSLRSQTSAKSHPSTTYCMPGGCPSRGRRAASLGYRHRRFDHSRIVDERRVEPVSLSAHGMMTLFPEPAV